MNDCQLNPQLKRTFSYVGNEQIPVWVIDDFVTEPEHLVSIACEIKGEIQATTFHQQASDFYPGIRKASPKIYGDLLTELSPWFKEVVQYSTFNRVTPVMSAFSIATTPESKLRPIQMLPHFDTPANEQLAVVHYLCEPSHGGTSLYRHKASGYERITIDRVTDYQVQLKQQAVAEQLHLTPSYINGSTALFEQIHCIEAKFNRAVIYPSNALHSGNINTKIPLSSHPATGRLTVSSFISLS